MIHETINYYNNNGSPVYICSLDATKAFDSCNWHVMFQKLLEKGIPRTIIQYLISSYLQSESTVMYNGCKSQPFALSQGVKQGSLLSPYLYNIYTENLIDILKESQMGTCLPDGTNTSVIAFADDLILMSPTLHGLQSLINKCSAYGQIHNIAFNHRKTQFVVSGKSYFRNPVLVLDREFVLPQDTLKHLGFIWKKNSHKLQLKNHMEYRLNEMWSVTSSLISSGVRHLHPNQIVTLYKSIVIPKLLYGLEIINITHTEKQYLNTQARCALKHLFGVSKHAKNLLNLYYRLQDITILLDSRKLSFIHQLSQNKDTSKYTLHLISLSNKDRRYSILRNLHDTCVAYDKNFVNCFFDRQTTPTISPVTQDTSWNTEKLNSIHDCIQNWHLHEKRISLKEILEAEIKR